MIYYIAYFVLKELWYFSSLESTVHAYFNLINIHLKKKF